MLTSAFIGREYQLDFRTSPTPLLKLHLQFTIERTAYPRFTSALTAHELDELYCPTEEDLEFVGKRADDPIGRLTLLARL